MAKRQQSSIDRLPEDLREQLNELLRDPRVQQLDAVARINAILAEEGCEERLSKSAVNRYAQKMDKVGARIRESREVAKMWISKLGAEPQGEVGKLLNEMIRNLAFDATTHMMDLTDENGESVPPDPKLLKELALAVERLERAASVNLKRDDEIRKAALKEAADRAGDAAQAQGMDEDQVRFWREKVLGMK